MLIFKDILKVLWYNVYVREDIQPLTLKGENSMKSRMIEKLVCKLEDVKVELEIQTEICRERQEAIEDRASERNSGEMTCKENERYEELDELYYEIKEVIDEVDNLIDSIYGLER